jgi:hypothetical protein
VRTLGCRRITDEDIVTVGNFGFPEYALKLYIGVPRFAELLSVPLSTPQEAIQLAQVVVLRDNVHTVFNRPDQIVERALGPLDEVVCECIDLVAVTLVIDPEQA